ncbi:MAG: divalent-cation tolerance protein CutA [Verrucomicrobiota bacterium]
MDERQKDSNAEVVVVITTFPNREKARQIGTQLVELQLAACVNLVSRVESIYAWKGKVEQEEEVIGLIKTTEEKRALLEAWMGDHHPYEVPELIALPLKWGARDYLDWVRSSLE